MTTLNLSKIEQLAREVKNQPIGDDDYFEAIIDYHDHLNPDMALALVARIRELEAEVKEQIQVNVSTAQRELKQIERIRELESYDSARAYDKHDLILERDQLRATLEAAEKIFAAIDDEDLRWMGVKNWYDEYRKKYHISEAEGG